MIYDASVTNILKPTPACRVYNNADISVANISITKLTFNSESFDTDNIHSTTSNTERLTCRTPGLYQITGHINFEANANHARSIGIKLNDTIYIARNLVQAVSEAGFSTRFVITTLYYLSVNDYVEIDAYQNSGGALKVLYLDDYTPNFMMVKVG